MANSINLRESNRLIKISVTSDTSARARLVTKVIDLLKAKRVADIQTLLRKSDPRLKGLKQM